MAATTTMEGSDSEEDEVVNAPMLVGDLRLQPKEPETSRNGGHNKKALPQTVMRCALSLSCFSS